MNHTQRQTDHIQGFRWRLFQRHKRVIFFACLLVVGSIGWLPLTVYAAPSITYDAVNNIMTMTAYTIGSPCTFYDFWLASDTNGWNVARMFQSDNVTIEFGCRLIIGGISTHSYFVDKDVGVSFNSTAVSGNTQVLIEVKYRGHLALGQLDDAGNKLSSHGVQLLAVDSGDNYIRLISGQHAGADIALYSSSFLSTSPKGVRSHIIHQLRNNAPVYNCLLDNVYFELSSIDGYRITMFNGRFQSRNTGTFDDLIMEMPERYVYWYQAETGNLANFVGRGFMESEAIYLQDITVDHNITNGDLDTWSFGWGGTSTGEIYRQYTLDLTVTYPNGTVINGTDTGARVVIQHYGQSNIVDYNQTLGADGTISQQTLSRSFYNQTGGDTEYSYNPYNLYVYNVTGYDNYSKNFTLSAQTEWEIALTASTVSTIPVRTRTTYGLILVGLCFVMAVPIGLFVLKKRR